MANSSLLPICKAQGQPKDSKPAESGGSRTSWNIVIPASDEVQLRKIGSDRNIDLPRAEPFVPPAHEAETYPDPGFSPLIVLVGVFAAGQIARIVFDLWGEYNHGGLVIDARKTPPELREHPSLKRGHVVIINPDGSSQNFQPSNETELERVVAALARSK